MKDNIYTNFKNNFSKNDPSLDVMNLAIFIPPRRLDIYEYDDTTISHLDFKKKIISGSPKVAVTLSQGRHIEGFTNYCFCII
jgi:hypothetical protein